MTLDTIYGFLERITYYNEDNHFLVAKIQEKGKKELTSIVGNLMGVSPGETLKLEGRWGHNKKYGLQFRVERFEIVMPSSGRGIEKYLASGLIKGIGPVIARRIVERFGPDTLQVIEDKPERLEEIEGIASRRIEMIKQAWGEQREIKEIMIFLQEHGVSAALAGKIFRKYQERSIAVLRENPYRLAADIYGIGFITADAIAQKLGIDPASIMRVKEGIIYLLWQVLDQGHVFFPLNELSIRARDLLQVEEHIVARALSELEVEKRIHTEGIAAGGTDGPDGPEGQAVYLTAFYITETGIADSLLSLKKQKSPLPPVDRDRALSWLENQLELQLAVKQKEAVAAAITEKVVVVTGGPGTGKTTIIRGMLRILQALDVKIALAAPTGRAAKRMQETTGVEALTIHRLLEFSPRERIYKRNQTNPLRSQVVIIDEASMIDNMLMYHLLQALEPPAVLILVGDTNQLPPVGPGNVLRDIIESRQFSVIELDEIFRQSGQSQIVVNAHRINRGRFPLILPATAAGDKDFYFLEEAEPQTLLSRILDLCSHHIPQKFHYDPLTQVQVLTPMHRGILGTYNMNHELQQTLNPRGKEISRAGKCWRQGDKVMQLVNNYDRETYNGDIGRIVHIDPELQEVIVSYDDRRAAYDFSELDELQLAYACSVHKSQGSEYPVVIMPLVTQHYMMLKRNVVYTAITRAQKMVFLLGTRKAMAIALRNNQAQERYSGLRQKLSG